MLVAAESIASDVISSGNSEEAQSCRYFVENTGPNVFELNISKIYQRITIAESVARMSDGVGQGRFKVGAVLFVKNMRVSIGYNQLKSDPLQLKYGKNEDSIFFHAEIHCLKNALRRYGNRLDFRKAQLYIARVKRHPIYHRREIWGKSRPCPGCMKAIRDFGISEVYYTLDEDEFGKAIACLKLN